MESKGKELAANARGKLFGLAKDIMIAYSAAALIRR
jgi:hypothetical protein